ncbi:MAG: MoaD/ThiS family protein [Candidatus Rokubacteria bacterium]|nr:MoaD/ThiS family protein [Candidatus Rokubacteria bacterium]
MSIRVQCMGPLANAIGALETVLADDAGLTLRALLDRLESRYGAEFGQRVFRTATAPRPLQMHTRIFVNGHAVDDSMLDTPLPAAGAAPGASEVLIYFMPGASGG